MRRTIRLTQLDGRLPNIALAKLAYWHRSQGDDVYYTRRIERDLFEPHFDIVYGSAIFDFSAPLIRQFMQQWPQAIVSGSGVAKDGGITVEEVIGVPLWSYEHYDYSIYPEFTDSIGFLARGCRLACKFCAVSKKEGAAVSVNTVADLWRGNPKNKKLHLLDNDFFGNPDWRARLEEIKNGKFRVCFSQGINMRLIDEEQAECIAGVEYRDTAFQERRLYTAWDSLRDEKLFFSKVEMLERAGIPPKHLMAYMIIGFDQRETWDDIWYRFGAMVERGILPYPMVYDRSRKDLLAFQRWANTGLYRVVPWSEYQRSTKSQGSQESFMRSKLCVPG